MRSQIMSQLFRNTTVPPCPGRATVLARAGLKAAPVSAPPMRMLRTKVGRTAMGARWGARPATAALAYLARMGPGPGLWGMLIAWLSTRRNHEGVRDQGSADPGESDLLRLCQNARRCLGARRQWGLRRL